MDDDQRRQRVVVFLGACALGITLAGAMLGAFVLGVAVRYQAWWWIPPWLLLTGWCVREMILFTRVLDRRGIYEGTLEWALSKARGRRDR